MLRMCGHISAGFLCCGVLLLQCKHNGFHDTVAYVQSEFSESVEYFDAFNCIIKICYTIQNIPFMHMQQYYEKHPDYLARTGCHSEKSRRKHDYLDLHNLQK